MNAKQILMSVFFGIIGGVIAFFAVQAISDKPSKTTSQSAEHTLIEAYKSPEHYAKQTALSSFGNNAYPDFNEAAESSLTSVVHITTQYNQTNYSIYDFIFGTGPSSNRPVTSSGSGVIVSPDGYIVTNNHVIAKSQRMTVVLNDKHSYTAELVGTDESTDIALLKVDAENLPYMKYGDSDEIKIGEWVLAVGNPFNLNSTVTAGIVSAKARNINILSGQYGIESFIQTDAAVNPGNSGGALVNTDGQLIGINTAIASKTGSYVGYSFAIPVNIVRKIVADIMEFGEVQRAYLGISMADIDAKLAKAADIKEIKGVYVASVIEDGAANKVGINAGDVILGFDDKPINSTSELMEQLSKYRPGDKMKISVRRENKIRDFRVELQNKFGNTAIVQADKLDELGASFQSLSDEEKRIYRLRNGVRVEKIYPGVFMDNRVREGFIITSMNNQAINSGNDIRNVLKDSKNEQIYMEGLYPNGHIAQYTFTIE
ncbi:MAG: Do family serine endopeptidase [Bacteroidales bacterium]|jgi:serine protease Do|nr:Do family serine endopeptidase [Bacteroidales bacterium]